MQQTQSRFSTVLKQLGHNTEVLVVDDSLVCRRALAAALTHHEFDVTEVASGAEALTLLREQTPDLVLSDVHMPEMDGYTLCRRLKQDPATRDLPVIFVTSEDDTTGRLEGFDAGGSDFIAKNADPLEIVARVRAHVQLACLRRELEHNRDHLAQQVREIAAQNQRERELRQQLEDQQAHILQSEKMASIGQLAAGVAHEINNPIGFVCSNLHTLGEYADDLFRLLRLLDPLLRTPAQTDWDDAITLLADAATLGQEIGLSDLLDDLGDLVRESIDGVARVRQIVADLRDFSHVDAPEEAAEDLNALLDKAVNVASNELKYKAEVVRDYGNLPPVPCQGGKLSQVFLNLLINAAQAIPDRGTITLTTRTEDRHAVIEVADTGKGIDPDKLGKIFDPFFTTKDVGQGTGLGLHLTYKIIEAHDGHIWVTSEPGVGTTFRITLPLQPTANPQAQEAEHACAA